VDTQVAAALLENNIDFIEDFLALTEEEMGRLKGVAPEQIAALRGLIEEFVEVVEEEAEEESYGEANSGEAGDTGAVLTGGAADESAEEEGPEGADAQELGDGAGEEEEEYECPECGAKITVDMTNCPNCGIGLSFEFEEE
jgi:N utilization substance protein A